MTAGLSEKLSHFVHRYFIWFLLASYVLAAIMPGPGLAMRTWQFGQIDLLGDRTTVNMPMVLLALLLANGGLATDTTELKALTKRPLIIAAGLTANILAPLALIFLVSAGLKFWHNPEECQYVLAGLTLIAAMPIAGASTAWSQNANGNLALSLALVLFSTFLSPLTTPFSLTATGPVLTGDYNEDLFELAGQGTTAFLAISVVLPVMFGVSAASLAGASRVGLLKEKLKLLNFTALLVLNYSNAATALPQAVQEHDYDFILLTVFIVAAFCFLSFFAGWLVAVAFKCDQSKKTSLLFALGMNNNGTALVLATASMSDHPMVLLQVIIYTLVQNLVAATVDFFYCRRT